MLSGDSAIKVGDLEVDNRTSTDAHIEIVLSRLNGLCLQRVDWLEDGQIALSFESEARLVARISRSFRADSVMWWLLQTNGMQASLDGLGMLEVDPVESIER